MTDEVDFRTEIERRAELLYTVMVKRMGIVPDWNKQSEWVRGNWYAVAEADLEDRKTVQGPPQDRTT